MIKLNNLFNFSDMHKQQKCLRFGGDDAPATPNFGPVPSAPEMIDFYDEIGRVKAIIATGPDGKKRRVVSRIPGTPQQEALLAKAAELVESTIANIQQLYKYNPREVANYQPLITSVANLNQETIQALGKVSNLGNIAQEVNNLKTIQRTLDDEAFAQERLSLEEKLSRAGLSNGTSGRAARALRDKNEMLIRQQRDIQATQFGEQLADQRFSRNARAFGLDELGRQKRLDEAKLGYDLEREQLAMQEAKRQQAINENVNLLNIGSGITGQDLRIGLSSQAAPLQNQTFAMEASDSLNRYNANVNARMNEYQAASQAYANRPPSFLDTALQIGGAVGGAMLTGSPGSLGGRLGTKVGSFFGV